MERTDWSSMLKASLASQPSGRLEADDVVDALRIAERRRRLTLWTIATVTAVVGMVVAYAGLTQSPQVGRVAEEQVSSSGKDDGDTEEPSHPQSPLAMAQEACNSAATITFRDFRQDGEPPATSAQEAASPYRQAGETLRLEVVGDGSDEIAIFSSAGGQTRQVLLVEADGHGGGWTIARTVSCLVPAAPDGDPACSESLEFAGIRYARDTEIPEGAGPGVGSVLGQARFPRCARVRADDGALLAPRGVAEPVTAYAYPELPASEAITVSVVGAPGSSSVMVYRPIPD